MGHNLWEQVCVPTHGGDFLSPTKSVRQRQRNGICSRRGDMKSLLDISCGLTLSLSVSLFLSTYSISRVDAIPPLPTPSSYRARSVLRRPDSLAFVHHATHPLMMLMRVETAAAAAVAESRERE